MNSAWNDSHILAIDASQSLAKSGYKYKNSAEKLGFRCCKALQDCVEQAVNGLQLSI